MRESYLLSFWFLGELSTCRSSISIPGYSNQFESFFHHQVGIGTMRRSKSITPVVWDPEGVPNPQCIGAFMITTAFDRLVRLLVCFYWIDTIALPSGYVPSADRNQKELRAKPKGTPRASKQGRDAAGLTPKFPFECVISTLYMPGRVLVNVGYQALRKNAEALKRSDPSA